MHSRAASRVVELNSAGIQLHLNTEEEDLVQENR